MIASEVSSKRNFLFPIILIFVIALIAGAGFLFFQYQKTHSSAEQKAKNETSSVVDQVGRLMELPVGEEPTIATVSDRAKLADQPFFNKAKDGDKVLIYQKASEAILYRPSINKIINVAPIDLGPSASPSALASPSASASASPASNKTYTVVIYNGTTVSGLGKTTQKNLESKVENVSVTGVHDAVKSDYTKTVVVDLKGGNSVEASTIAKAVNGTVGPLPEGESKPSGTDLIIIVGQ